MSIVRFSAPFQVASGALSTGATNTQPVAPEFLVALNRCSPPAPPPSSLPENGTTLTAILEHVVARLKSSLDPIWTSPDGHDPEWQPRPSSTPAEKAEIEAEEVWARWCTELMVGTGYGGPKEYDSGKFGDERFFKAFNGDNPTVPVKMACQQLCTYAYYSRGLTYDEVASPSGKSVGVTASNNSHIEHLFVGKKWDTDGSYANIPKAYSRPAGRMGPGTILGFLPTKGTGQSRGSHVVFVLRSAPGVMQAQLFDTGAATEGSTKRSKTGNLPLAAATLVGGNYDNCLYGGTVGVYTSTSPVACCGIGVLEPIAPAKILAGVEKARRARPLGFARLAVLKRVPGNVQKEHILYVSPRVWMHDTGSDANYHVSRFLWSLRGTPGYENLEVLWQIAHPQFALAEAAFDAPRTTPLKDLWKRGSQYVAFLTLSNDAKGAVHMRHRAKLVPEAKGQRWREDGSAERYQNVVEYVVHRPDVPPPPPDQPYRFVKGIFQQTDPGKHVVAEPMSSGFTPPPYFAPW